MIQRKSIQIAFHLAYCLIGILGILGSLGAFAGSFRSNFFVFFTNLSNYVCFGMMLAECIQSCRKKGNGYVTVAPALKFISMQSILLTFLVFNFLLGSTFGYGISSILLHIVLPILYVLDWLLFYERKTVKWLYPVLSVTFPLAYVAFIYIRAAIWKFDTTAAYLYPYFFLNPETQGVTGVLKWIGILLLCFITMGYIFYGIDRIGKSKNHKKIHS